MLAKKLFFKLKCKGFVLMSFVKWLDNHSFEIKTLNTQHYN